MQTSIIAQDSKTDGKCDAQSIAINDRLRSLEREMSELTRQLDRIDANREQLHRQRNTAMIQILIICVLTLFSILLPAPVVNGWLYGTYVFLIVCVCSDRRPLGQLASGLIALGVIYGWAISQVFDFLDEELPGVFWIAVLYFPFALSVLHPILKSLNLTLTVPEHEAFIRTHLRIRDLLVSTTSIALFFAVLKVMSANLPEQEQRQYQMQAAVPFICLLASAFLTTLGLRLIEMECNVSTKLVIYATMILIATGLSFLTTRTMFVEELTQFSWIGFDDDTWWESIAAQNSASPESVCTWSTIAFSFTSVAAQLTTRWLLQPVAYRVARPKWCE